MNNKYIYIIIGVVVVFIMIMLYQKQQNDLKIKQQQDLLLAQNPNTQFQNTGVWGQLIGGVLGGFTQAYASNSSNPKS